MITVCCAIILEGDKILAVQRGSESQHPDEWEFPGGKIQSGESAKNCIVREIEEELMIQIETISELESVEYDYGIKQIKLIPFVCKIVSGDIKLTEHVSLSWFAIDDWTRFEWLAADHKLILKNHETLKQILKTI